MLVLSKKEALALRGEDLRLAFGLFPHAPHILREARKLIADRKRWTRFQLARDAMNEPVDPNSKDAVCWCAQGAVHRAASNWSDANGLVNLLSVIAQDDGCHTIWSMNDRARNGHERVLACFDRAIEMVK